MEASCLPQDFEFLQKLKTQESKVAEGVGILSQSHLGKHNICLKTEKTN